MNKNATSASVWQGIGLLLILSLVWGSSFILIKRALVAFSWDQVASLRMSFTMLAFLPILVAQLRKIKDRKTYFYIFIMATLGNAIPAFLFPIAQTQISSSLAGVLNSCVPLFTLIIGAISFGTIITRNKALAVIVGIAGALLIILYKATPADGGFGGNSLYGGFVLLATLCYGINANVVKTHLQNIPPWTSGAIAFAMVGPFAMTYLFTTDFVNIMQTHETAWTSLGSVAFLGVIGTGAATILFVHLIQKTSAVFGTMVSYIIPVVALMFGLWDGEIITIWQGVGIVLILTGVYLARK